MNRKKTLPGGKLCSRPQWYLWVCQYPPHWMMLWGPLVEAHHFMPALSFHGGQNETVFGGGRRWSPSRTLLRCSPPRSPSPTKSRKVCQKCIPHFPDRIDQASSDTVLVRIVKYFGHYTITKTAGTFSLLSGASGTVFCTCIYNTQHLFPELEHHNNMSS